MTAVVDQDVIASPLRRMALDTPTEFWNDSCDPGELAYAIARGATGATSNPGIVLDVMRSEKPLWVSRVRELAAANAAWSEVELAWAIADEMAVRGAALLRPVFDATGGQRGRQAIQVNPANYRDSARMVEQALHFASLAPNLHVKFPATAAAMVAIEEATVAGVSTLSTVSFTLSQAIAAAEAGERGLDRRAAAGLDISTVTPMVVLMIGRLDDWLRVLIERDGLAVDPAAPAWAGIAVFKRTYQLFHERGYRSRILVAATRHPLHWTELIGADAAMTLTHGWQVRFNASGIEPRPRIDVPVGPAILDELQRRFPDFVRAYEPDGLTTAEFDTFGPTVRTLRGFTTSYHDLLAAIRDILLPNPDVRPA
jgi:transaldolase